MPAIIVAGASLSPNGDGAVEAAPFPGVQCRPAARTTCRSTESVRSRSGNSAPAAPPSTVIEFIRWSVRLATSNSRHGVCLSGRRRRFRAAHAPARRRSLRRIRVRPPAANRVLHAGRPSCLVSRSLRSSLRAGVCGSPHRAGSRCNPHSRSSSGRHAPTLRRACAYRCPDEDARAGGSCGADPGGPGDRVPAHHRGHCRHDDRAGTPISSGDARRRSRRFRDCRTSRSPTSPACPGCPARMFPMYPHRRMRRR